MEAKGIFMDKREISSQPRSERHRRPREEQEERPKGGNEEPRVGGADGAGAQGCRLGCEDEEPLAELAEGPHRTTLALGSPRGPPRAAGRWVW